MLRSMLARMRSGLAESRDIAKGTTAPRSIAARTDEDAFILVIEFNNSHSNSSTLYKITNHYTPHT